MKKTFFVILTAVLVIAAAVLPSAAATDILEVKRADKVTLDGIVELGEYAVSYTVDKPLVQSLGGDACWVGQMSDETRTVFNLAWDKTGLYVAASVYGDTTPIYASTWDSSLADCVQINLFSDSAANYWFTVGARADGTIVGRTHYADENVCGFGDNLNGKITGKSVRNDGVTVYEFMIPWQYVTNGTTHAAIAEAGEEFAVLFACIDFEDSYNAILAYKSASEFPGSGNNIPVRCRLSSDGTASDPAVPTDDPSDDSGKSGNVTFNIILASVAVVASVAVAALALKDKRK